MQSNQRCFIAVPFMKRMYAKLISRRIRRFPQTRYLKNYNGILREILLSGFLRFSNLFYQVKYKAIILIIGINYYNRVFHEII